MLSIIMITPILTLVSLENLTVNPCDKNQAKGSCDGRYHGGDSGVWADFYFAKRLNSTIE